MLVASLFCLFGLLVQSRSTPVQNVLEVPIVNRPRHLQGRFLQITDLHPDPFYLPGTSTSKACHTKFPKKKKKRAGYYGTPYSECDSPLTLTNYTLDFLEEHWADDIDFVIWTGDNARHENDPKIPRTTNEIYEMNDVLAKRMNEIFTIRGIPVIPSLGPNSIINEFLKIWQSFVPFPYHQAFRRGAYFAVEVVPNALAVISLNTLYFYDANDAVSGCNYNEPDDPGNLQFAWLEDQLKSFRKRGMQVWVTGHVPPSNYFPECYVQYVRLALNFQDTILGHLYGHKNADHFFFVEAKDLESGNNISRASKHNDLYDSLVVDFAQLPKPKKTDLDEYAIINVSPPVVPNPYLPTFRIFTYNITGVEKALADGSSIRHVDVIDTGTEGLLDQRQVKLRDELSHCTDELCRNSWKCRLQFDPPQNADAPSRTSRLWTPLGYAQFFIPHLKDADKSDPPHYKLEYTTFPASVILPEEGQNQTEIWYPIPLRNLPKSVRNGKMKKKYFPYGMQDLTIGSWLDLARRLGDIKEKKLRKRFRQYMYLGGTE
ncbi:Metallo-dependent phosphatase-like protein [Lentinula boryana]|uniref:Metallo-dependent phosphatase-like protein n=1 Tax=Lentinula boryana TaxID=40481 RepID=A0ABQ8QET8_9AGAR|nr:Metallo-dependent phosphatase-like protein [Lentinula boryana]